MYEFKWTSLFNLYYVVYIFSNYNGDIYKHVVNIICDKQYLKDYI